MTSLLDQLLDQRYAEGREEGLVRGKQEDVLEVLSQRFGSVPADITARVTEVTDLSRLQALLASAIGTGSLDEFSAGLNRG